MISKSLDREMAAAKARLVETFRNEVKLSKECANRGDPVMAWFHRNTAESIARYLETLK